MIFNSEESWNTSAYNKSIPRNFEKIDSPEGIALYLDHTYARTKRCNYVYHYTTLSTLVEILRGRRWHLANARNMNDQLEYSYGDPDRWKKIFFSSFMMNAKESIGMWSMYAQPWASGVKIAIPLAEMKKWIKNKPEIFGVKENKENADKRFDEYRTSVKIDGVATVLRLSAVAYSNAKDLESDETEQLTCGEAKNSVIKNAPDIPELTGYVKDKAWDYERELRLKITFSDEFNYDRVALEVPEYIIDAMTITTGPLFEGDLREKLQEEIKQQTKIEHSIFTDRLFIKTICDNCERLKSGITVSA